MTSRDGASPPRPGHLGSLVLGLVVFIGFVLVLLLGVPAPADQLTVAVGPGQAEQCPTGGATACFRFNVTNTGRPTAS